MNITSPRNSGKDMVDLVAQLISEITELSAIDFNISRDKNDKNLASLAFNKLIVSNFLCILDDFFYNMYPLYFYYLFRHLH